MEDYYTYQSQSIGNAGTGYISDYSLQLTVAKNISSYSSTVMSCDIGLVYNSASCSSYFTNSDSIHTKDFSSMNTGLGWKLNLQETLVPVEVEDLEDTTEYLVYNDSDGTEHYFHYNKETAIYEDEDGLGLTITGNNAKYTMADEKDNEKIFENGYLKTMKDANGNQINIVYNASNQISSVTLDTVSGAPVTIYNFIYDTGSKCLTEIHDYGGRKYLLAYAKNSDNKWNLRKISRRTGDDSTTETVEAEYLYDANSRLTRAYDAESKNGIEYTYYKSPTGYHVYECRDFAAGNIGTSEPVYGTEIRAWPIETRQTRYRYWGMDRKMGTEDDIVTTYLFNSAGQTINASSEDGNEDRVLGVTAAAYEENSGTNKTNNRMNQSVSSGQSGINLLINGGFEKAGSSDTIAESWSSYTSSGAAARKSDGVTTGLAYSGKCYYNLFGSSISAISSIYQDITVVQGETYTFSAYVNTKDLVGTNKGVYLYARQIDNQNILAESVIIDYVTDASLDGGWQRLTATFTAPSTAVVRFTVCCSNVYGIIRVDNVQMENSSAASRYNHVYNGSFERADEKIGWDVSGNGTITVTTDDEKHGNIALKMTAAAPEASLCAVQTIELQCSSNTTFLLSGWGRADSIPDLADEIEGKNDTSLKYWGITLTLNYSDGTAPEYFHLPFNDYATDWQYAAMAVVPKPENANKTITTAVLKLYYQNNANTAYFDSISLIEEPAQTYKYDKEGNLVSVKSSGNGEEEYEFKEGTMDLTKVATQGSGDYEYVYPKSGNTHLPSQIKNDNVVMDIIYDTDGQTTKTTLSDSSTNGSDLFMESTADYNDGLLRKITDNTEASVSYDYDSMRRLVRVTDATGNKISTRYDSIWDRAVSSYQSGVISVANTYTNGNLTEISRGGYITEGGTKQTQKYQFTYDAFGRNTSVSAGGYKLADYHYNGAGLLSSIDYGVTDVPQAVVEYTYDELERVEEASYYNNWTNETISYGYLYASDGNLAGITKNGELLYVYDYDTLGRLIHSSMLEEGKATLYTGHKYDTSNRIVSQNWQIGNDAFSETYSYEEKDGTLKQMTTGGDTLTFDYDVLKRFNTRTSPVLKVDYDYRSSSTDSNKTTTQVSQIKYTDAAGTDIIPALGYTYDALGNIKKVTSGNNVKQAYTYDEQNQLKGETLFGYDGGTLYGTYTYDTYGNIRSIRSSLSGVEDESYTLEYGNSTWLDRLTKVTYTDKDGNVSSGTLSYDQIGNPEEYFNGHDSWNFTWKFGRQLTNATNGTKVVSYTYDVDGIRQSKIVDGWEYKYTTLNGKVVREVDGGVTTDYFYDNEGKPYKLVVNNGSAAHVGYYVLNQQGDVIAILDETGGVAVTYEYNAWGKILDETGSGTLVSIYLQSYNHLKYRGYYHDTETGFYYLESRYYDPTIGRFVSADTTVSTGQGFLGCNMYIYCLNNPVNYVDYSGYEAVAIQNALEWWTSGMWWLCGSDGLLPVGEIAYVGGIILLAMLPEIPLQVDITSDMVIEQPISDVVTNKQSKYEKALERLQKSVALTKSTVRNGEYNYWIASYVGFGYRLGNYVPTDPLTFSQALTVVRAGGNVFAVSEKHAYKLARAAGYGRIPEWDPPHGGLGYYKHYHAKKSDRERMGGHIFYL